MPTNESNYYEGMAKIVMSCVEVIEASIKSMRAEKRIELLASYELGTIEAELEDIRTALEKMTHDEGTITVMLTHGMDN